MAKTGGPIETLKEIEKENPCLMKLIATKKILTQRTDGLPTLTDFSGGKNGGYDPQIVAFLVPPLLRIYYCSVQPESME